MEIDELKNFMILGIIFAAIIAVGMASSSVNIVTVETKTVPSAGDGTPRKSRKKSVAESPKNVQLQSPKKVVEKQSKTAKLRLIRDHVLFSRVASPDKKVDVPPNTMSKKSEIFLTTALNKNNVFKQLEQSECKYFTEHSVRGSFKKGAIICKQGEPAEYFYVIENGTVQVSINNKPLSKMVKGSSFGEMALLSGAPRAATITALTDCVLWRMERDMYRTKMANATVEHAKDTRECLSNFQVLKNLPAGKLDKLSRAVTKRTYTQGNVIVSRGESGHSMFMIKSGSVVVKDIGDNMRDIILGEGQYFGERALETGDTRKATVIARDDCELLQLERTVFDSFFGGLREAIDEHHEHRVLVSSIFFSFIEPGDTEKYAKAFVEKPFASGVKITEQGKDQDSFFIIKCGTVSAQITPNEPKDAAPKELMRLTEGQFFSIQALLRDSKTVFRRKAVEHGAMETCIALTNVVCWVLGPKQVKTVASKQFMLNAKKAYDARLALIQAATKETVCKNRLTMHNILGKGTFGTVKLVQDSQTKNVYSLKIIRKETVVKYNQQENILSEKNIMLSCTHPFINNLHMTYKDDSCLYFLLEYCNGGELFSQIHKDEGADGISAEATKFYSSCLVLVLCYLLERDIKYRDLKPENILIDSVGYLKLIDFGFAKQCSGLSFTLCGTPEYMAPEIILGRGYDHTIDWWALGILIYECIVGTTPFEGSNQKHTCDKILRATLFFPSRNAAPFDDHSKNLISMLLRSRPKDRLTNGPAKGQAVKNHDWFLSIDWDSTLAKSVKPPWIPKCKNILDTRNFPSGYYTEDPSPKRWVDPAPGWDAGF